MSASATLGSPLVEQSPVPATPELEQYLDRVEYYQPLYGISGFEPALRGCRDRALAIEAALAPQPSPLRLIDFGSSLGYFPFFFADRGAVTAGFDINPANTAVALATQRLTGIPTIFKTAALDLDTVRAIAPGTCDVALILSVLHHITHKQGLDYVATLMADLLARIPTLILELAHKNEDVKFAWQASLPENPLDILKNCPGVQTRLLGHFASHLSASTRPMYMVCR